MAINLTLNRIQLVKETTHRYNLPRTISCPDDVAKIGKMVFHMDEEAQEVLALIFLNVKNNIVGLHELSRGSATASIVHPREVFKSALLHNAASIIMMHNHPSGDIETISKEDIATTKRIDDAGKLMDIPLLDHVIISDSGYTSLKERNIL